MARKKKRIKVKRYQHSFYSSVTVVKNLFLWLTIMVVVGGVGYFIAPTVIDFGTRTWYSLTRSTAEAPSSSVEPTPEPSPSSEAEPEPTPPSEENGLVEGSFADVTLSALATPELIADTVAQLAAQGVTYVVVPLKDTSGYIHYPSAVQNTAASIAAAVVDPAAIASAISGAGMIPVASLSAFQDPIALYQDRDMGIRYANSDYMWFDNAAEAGGKPWLNPYSPKAIEFVGSLMAEVSSFGFTHIQLSQVQFPVQVSDNQDFGATGGVSRADALRAAVSAWQTRFEGQLTIWYQYPYETCLAQSNTTGELPQTLGMEHVMIALPLPSAETATVDPAQLAAVEDLFWQNNVSYLVVKDGNAASFCSKPSA